jgi:hypothetical protein
MIKIYAWHLLRPFPRVVQFVLARPRDMVELAISIYLTEHC